MAVADANVVVAASGGEVAGLGGVGLVPGFGVVEVALAGGHATSWESTEWMMGFDLALLGGGGSSSGDAVSDGHPGMWVGDDEPPRTALCLLFGDLAGDIGNHRAISG